ncbi:MAG: hypothetical protein ACE366_09355 [Bradymonadia bacterium]
MATPLQQVKNEFGSKEALVDKLLPMLDKGAEEDNAEFKARLVRVSNAKLLRLWHRENNLRDKFGSREALVDKIVELKTAGKGNADYRRKLLGQSTGRLLNLHSSLARAAK